jgi:hypothetical protein
MDCRNAARQREAGLSKQSRENWNATDVELVQKTFDRMK